MALIQGQVGASGPAAAGSQALPARQMGDGTVGVADCHGRYTESVLNGNVYFVGDTAGRTTAAGLTTAPVCVSLYNPLGSGVVLSLLYASAQFLVAFAAASAIWIGLTPTGTATATTGTAINATNCKGTVGGSKVQALTTATLPATPTIIADLGVGLTGAITTVPQVQSMYRWFDGAIQVGPGGALSLQVSTASGTSSSLMNWMWEEIPIALV